MASLFREDVNCYACGTVQCPATSLNQMFWKFRLLKQIPGATDFNFIEEELQISVKFADSKSFKFQCMKSCVLSFKILKRHLYNNPL